MNTYGMNRRPQRVFRIPIATAWDNVSQLLSGQESFEMQAAVGSAGAAHISASESGGSQSRSSSAKSDISGSSTAENSSRFCDEEKLKRFKGVNLTVSWSMGLVCATSSCSAVPADFKQYADHTGIKSSIYLHIFSIERNEKIHTFDINQVLQSYLLSSTNKTSSADSAGNSKPIEQEQQKHADCIEAFCCVIYVFITDQGCILLCCETARGTFTLLSLSIFGNICGLMQIPCGLVVTSMCCPSCGEVAIVGFQDGSVAFLNSYTLEMLYRCSINKTMSTLGDFHTSEFLIPDSGFSDAAAGQAGKKGRAVSEGTGIGTENGIGKTGLSSQNQSNHEIKMTTESIVAITVGPDPHTPAVVCIGAVIYYLASTLQYRAVYL